MSDLLLNFHFDSNDLTLSSGKTTLKFSEKQLHWCLNAKDYSIKFDHIIGAAPVVPDTKPIKRSGSCCNKPENILELAAENITSQLSNYWVLYALTITKNKDGDVDQPVFRQILFSTDNNEDTTNAVHLIRSACRYTHPSNEGKKLLFIINPFGGVNLAMSIYEKYVLPMAKMAGLFSMIEIIETQQSLHAVELAQKLDISKYRSICTISGDGVFHEVINGLLSRDDWREAVKIPLGTIGAGKNFIPIHSSGSANAIGKNLDTIAPELSMLSILNCNTRKMDAFAIVQNNSVTYSHLSVSWAFIADIDIESETYRQLGSLRFTLAAIIRLARLRTYSGKLSVLLSEEAANYEIPEAAQCNTYKGPKTKYVMPGSTAYQSWPTQIDSNFQFFMACNMPWISKDFICSPTTKIDDGELVVMYSDSMGRSGSLACVLDSERGAHMTMKSMKHYRVKAFSLVPYGHDKLSKRARNDTESNSSVGLLTDANLILDVSGERIPYSPIQVEVIPSVLNLIVPEWLDAERWASKFHAEFPTFVE
ncbi:ATP-NAD kinase-like domain-containing protein [Globomyces pollinis-pini]|nr:ATP-NAD kinase-like domain-containing protein [Globomyces pollinis-pini]